jgi:hypothetical protein
MRGAQRVQLLARQQDTFIHEAVGAGQQILLTWQVGTCHQRAAALSRRCSFCNLRAWVTRHAPSACGIYFPAKPAPACQAATQAPQASKMSP